MTRRSLLATPIILIPARANSVSLAATPIARLDTKWWRERHEAKLAELQRVMPDLIWLGDSITQNFERNGPEPWAHYTPIWQQFYGAYRSVNLGFKGDATSHLLWRIIHGELDDIAPRLAIVLIGANNLGRLHWSAADSVTGISTIVAEINRRLPNTRVLLLGLLPSDRSAWASQTTVDINTAMRALYSMGNKNHFLDATTLFMRGFALDLQLYYDPMLNPPEPALHPTAAGMAKLAARIAPLVTDLMKI